MRKFLFGVIRAFVGRASSCLPLGEGGPPKVVDEVLRRKVTLFLRGRGNPSPTNNVAKLRHIVLPSPQGKVDATQSQTDEV